MSMADTTSPLPRLYARWARELLGGDPPNETRATCLDCAMTASGHTGRRRRLAFFHPRTKCCTYTPVLPNFLAGAILADRSAEAAHGRASVLERIAAREKVTPLGVDRPAAVEAVYTALAPERFGTDLSMRCPHMTDDDLCGVWHHRNCGLRDVVLQARAGRRRRSVLGAREGVAAHRRAASWRRGASLEAGWPPADLAVLLAPERPAGADVAQVVRPVRRARGEPGPGVRPSSTWRAARRVAALPANDVATIGGASTQGAPAVAARCSGTSVTTRSRIVLVPAPLVVVKRREGRRWC